LREEDLDPLAKAAKYYNLVRKLSFPSSGEILAEIILTATVGCGVSFLLATPTIVDFVSGCLIGVMTLALPSILTEAALSKLVLRNDPLFYLRRCLALSLIVNCVWILFLLAGGALSRVVPGFPQKSFLMGMACAYSLRAFAVFSISESSFERRFAAAVAQPLACTTSALILLRLPPAETALLLTVAATVSPVLLYPLLIIIERRGKRTIGISLITLFRALLAVFLDMRNEHLEKHLDELGSVEKIGTSVLMFKSMASSRTKAVVVVSDFHPGPFLNVGSSLLPMLIQNMVESETGAPGMIPHGVSGHERNIVSQSENQKVIEQVKRLLVNGQRTATASTMIRTSTGSASATCQSFGKYAMVTLTISPKDMEDVPQEVSLALQCELLAFEHLALIDSHNCIDKLKPITAQDSSDLITSGKNAIQKAAREEQEGFKVGASKAKLTEFSLDQGIGPCGLSVIVIDVGGFLSAYVTIDGNNMKPGLRDRVLEMIGRIGIPKAEIMTTDNHMVSGRVSTRLGYHPVGEAIDEKLLLSRVEMAVKAALDDLEDSEAEWSFGDVSVKTLGRETFERLTELIQDMSKLVAYWLPLMVLIPVLLAMAVLR